MSDKNGYMDISELPEVQQIFSRWPWREWEKIPVGKMLDITATAIELAGDIRHASQTLRNKASIRGMQIAIRKDRLFLTRPVVLVDRRLKVQ